MNLGNLQIESNHMVVSSNKPVSLTTDGGSVQSSSSLLSDLSVGDTISGKMISREGNVVQLLLSDETVIQAKLEKELQMQPGQMITFTVKSSGQSGMSLMPLFTNTSDMNTAAKALMNAGLTVTDKSMKMVSSMMEEGMPIGKDSLLFMKGQMNTHPTADVTNLVQMQRMGIAITEENIEQFSNYKNYEHQINHATDHIAGLVSDTLGEMIASGNANEAVRFYKDVVGMIVDSEMTAEYGIGNKSELLTQLSDSEMATLAKAVVDGNVSEADLSMLKEQLSSLTQTGEALPSGLGMLQHAVDGNFSEQDQVLLNQLLSEMDHTAEQGKILDAKQILESLRDINEEANVVETQANVAEALSGKDDASVIATLERLMKGVTEETDIKDDTALQAEKDNSKAEVAAEAGTDDVTTSKGELSKSELQQLSNDLQKLGASDNITSAFEKGEISGKELLAYVHKNFHSEDKLQELLGSKAFRKVVANELSNAWKITPEQTSSKTEVKDLYKRIDEQTRQIMDALQATTKADSPLASAVTKLQNNLDFMNQLNQMFPYIQLPLSMSGSDAHGELYVYTNKKNLAKQDGSVSALLHLDMEHLGTLDVMVKMNSDQHVNTNFCVADESVLDLIEAHIDELTSRLNKRGYKIETSFSLQEKATNVMEEMIKQDRSISMISTTAFDARA